MKSKEMMAIFNIIAELWTGPNKKLLPSAKTIWQRALSPYDFNRVRSAIEEEYEADPNKLPKIASVLEKIKSPSVTSKDGINQSLDQSAASESMNHAKRMLKRKSELEIEFAESIAKESPLLSALAKRRWSPSWIAAIYNIIQELDDL